MSVVMSNAGALGWVTDQSGGYRYQSHHPVTGRPWPAIPERLIALWQELAQYPKPPEACLINLYGPRSRLGCHVDADEEDMQAPVLSVSLGADAVFHIGGPKRGDPKVRFVLRAGDVLVLGGEARQCHHGIDRVLPCVGPPLLGAATRINLTLRRVTR